MDFTEKKLKMKDRQGAYIKYWLVLFNPLLLLVYTIGLRAIYEVCQLGGVRRRLPLIAICGLAGLIWMITWTTSYFIRKHKTAEKAVEREEKCPKVWGIWLSLEIMVLLVTTLFYGAKIVHSAQPYNGKLSWKIEEIKNSQKILLKHHNFYKDGVNGILDDLKEKLELPAELYIANTFSIEFDGDGTITDIYSVLYGKGSDGKGQSYLIDYNSKKSEKMTVWRNNYTKETYEEAMKLAPMLEILNLVDVEKQLQSQGGSYQEKHFGILYQGYRSFPSMDGILALKENGTIDTTYQRVGVEDIAGYEVSLYVPGEKTSTPIRYLNTWKKIDIKQEDIKKDTKEADTKGKTKKPGVCIKDATDGALYYYMDEKQGWRLVVTDAAAGSRYYELEATEDAGTTWNKVNTDPFLGDIGVAEGFVFFSKELAYLQMGTATGNYSSILVSKDAGKTFEKLNLPLQNITETNIPIEEYDYLSLPNQKDGKLQLLVGKDGSRQEKELLFESADQGETWNYAGLADNVSN